MMMMMMIVIMKIDIIMIMIVIIQKRLSTLNMFICRFLDLAQYCSNWTCRNHR